MFMKTYLAYDPDTGDESDAKDFKAIDEKDAAVEYAKWYDWKYAECYQDRRLVMVKEESAGEWVKFEVTAEQDIRYSAYQE
jgi:hypothetical protein